MHASINGVEVGQAVPELPRADVAERCGPEFEHCGWRLVVDSPERTLRPDDILLLHACTASGHITPLWIAPIEGADLTQRATGALDEVRNQNRLLRVRCHELEQRIRAMEQSFFWRLRNRWFGLKRLLVRRPAP